MRTVVIATLLGLLRVVTAAADEPKDPVAASPAASDAAVKSAEQLAAEQAARDKEAKLAAAAKLMRSRGYKPVTRKDGTVVYCRNEAPVGSRFEQQTCGSLESLAVAEQTGKDMMSDVQRNSLRTPNSH